MNEVKVEPGLGSIPEKGTTYWYIRGCMQTHRFKVCEMQFIGGMTEILRIAKGNFYLNQKEANNVMLQLNERVDDLARILGQKKVLEERKAEQERLAKENEVKAKAKAKTKKSTKKEKPIPMTVAEKAQAYERNKKKRIHPDVLP